MDSNRTFYSLFPDYYESVFPFRQVTYNFLRSQITREGVGVLDLGCGDFNSHPFQSDTSRANVMVFTKE